MRKLINKIRLVLEWGRVGISRMSAVAGVVGKQLQKLWSYFGNYHG